MTQVFFIVLAILSGAGISMQAGMLGAIGTARTPAAAVWISLLATVVGLTAFVIYRYCHLVHRTCRRLSTVRTS